MLVFTEDVSLPALGSGVDVLTVAVFVMEPACLGITAMSIVALPTLPRAPNSQVTTPESCTQVPWLGVAETNVTLVGNVSVTIIPAASSGPPLVTVTV